MISFLGKVFASITISISSLFGIHSIPSVVPFTSTPTLVAPESDVGKTEQELRPAVKVVPVEAATMPVPVSSTVPNTPSQPAQPSIPAVPPPNTILCNSSYYTTCPSGQYLVCPSSGTAFCQPSAASVTAQEQADATTAQKKIDSITAECNSQINAFNQQILGIKNGYYAQVSAIQKQAIPLEFQNGQITKLTNDANQKIAKIDLQIQQVQLDCQSKLNQL